MLLKEPRKEPRHETFMKPTGSRDGNTGMLLQQSCQPGSCHQHSLLLQETQQKFPFSAEIVFFSVLAEAVLSSGNATPFPRAHLHLAGTHQLQGGLLSPGGFGDTRDTVVAAVPRSDLSPGTLRSSCSSVPGSPNPKSCKKHPASDRG